MAAETESHTRPLTRKARSRQPVQLQMTWLPFRRSDAFRWSSHTSCCLCPRHPSAAWEMLSKIMNIKKKGKKMWLQKMYPRTFSYGPAEYSSHPISQAERGETAHTLSVSHTNNPETYSEKSCSFGLSDEKKAKGNTIPITNVINPPHCKVITVRETDYCRDP